MMRLLSRQLVRSVDQKAIQEYHIPGIVLMENAGRGAAAVIASLGNKSPTTILCGPGNNGGDGFVVARHLQLASFPIHLVLVSPPDRIRGDAAVNYQIVKAAGLAITVMPSATELESIVDRAQLIVDGLLGTGATGAPRPEYATAIRIANRTDAVRVALDIPSGIDCDTGLTHDPTFQAHHTCTFVAAKPGLVTEAARGHVGQIHVIPIGIPQKLLREVNAQGTAYSGPELQ